MLLKMGVDISRLERPIRQALNHIEKVFQEYEKEPVPCNLCYLKNKMAQTGHIDISESLTKEKLVKFLYEKIKEIDFEMAKNDVEPFLKNSGQREELSLWSDTFFSDYLIQAILVQTSN